MRLLITLALLWVACAIVDHVLFAVRRRKDQIVDELIALEAADRAMRDANTLLCLYHVTNLLDTIYLHTSALGVKYDTYTRRVIAANVQIAREIIAQRAGPSPVIDWSHAPGNTWPFTKDGKVKL